MPANCLVDFGAQAKRTGGSPGRRRCVRGGIPCQKIRMNNHQLALAEVFAVVNRLRNGFTSPRADIAERAQALAHGGQCGRHFLRVQPRHAENTRLNAGYRFRREKRLQAGIFNEMVTPSFPVLC